jgi:hypothetical protein
MSGSLNIQSELNVGHQFLHSLFSCLLFSSLLLLDSSEIKIHRLLVHKNLMKFTIHRIFYISPTTTNLLSVYFSILY